METSLLFIRGHSWKQKLEAKRQASELFLLHSLISARH